ncbi:hypothetical protein CK203_045629 [Vitis vinifera]|uniref:Uncharacterized protein n=1 Tax=Vitis vinifera TaxID=29760 RepID=A0A438HQ18_VITVI|nr:hypothetical protein CK203_045629 [Vitis vinifera]
MPLSQALRKLIEAGLLTALTPRPLPQPISSSVQDGFTTPSVTTNPLPTHTTHALLPPADGIHFLDFDEIDGHVHMLSWDDPDPEPIMPAGIYETSGVTLEPQMSAPFRLVPEGSICTGGHFRAFDIHALIAPPPAAARPVEGTSASQEERPPVTPPRCTDSSSEPDQSRYHDHSRGTHSYDDGCRATCIVFSDDDLPPEGSDHTRPLYISVGCSGRRVPSVLLDNGSALNVCPFATAIALGYAPSDFGPSTQTVRGI